MRKTEIRVETVDSFFVRGRKIAELAGRRERIPLSRVVAFDGVEELLGVLSAKRVLLLKAVVKEAPGSITELARRLKRDRSAVTRDVKLLASYGVVRVTEKPLPGHGRQKWVGPVAREIQLVAQF